jgi:hypothetical protein
LRSSIAGGAERRPVPGDVRGPRHADQCPRDRVR